MVKASDAFNMAMESWNGKDKENLDNYLSSISNQIENAASSGKMLTTVNMANIHHFFDLNIDFKKSLIAVVEINLKNLGYNVDLYENPFGEWMTIKWEHYCK